MNGGAGRECAISGGDGEVSILSCADAVQVINEVVHHRYGRALHGARVLDGDGVGDSKWVKLDDISSHSGKQIYAAIRIIDNAAMLNANTSFKMDPTEPNATILDIAGTSQMQINLMALAFRPGNSPPAGKELDLLRARANYGLNVNPMDLRRYKENVIWRVGDPNGLYTPFDISDELEMRYRFILNNTETDSRLENWSSEFRNSSTLSTPVSASGQVLSTWYKRAHNEDNVDPNYAYRHIVTIYSMDRIINPAGAKLNNGKMVNVNLVNADNQADIDLLFAAIRAGLREPNALAADKLAAQLTVNIIDYRDEDTDITTLQRGAKTFYGFEAQPFISEITFQISGSAANNTSNNLFAIELYNPFDVDIPLGDFRLELRRDNGQVEKTIRLTNYAIAPRGRFVITNGAKASSQFAVTQLISTGQGRQDPNLVLAEYTVSADPAAYVLSQKYNIYLLRSTQSTPVVQLYLDKQLSQDTWFDWNIVKDNSKSYCRADTNWNIIYHDFISEPNNTLGKINGTSGTKQNYNFSNSIGSFTTIGEIARVLTVAPGTDPNDMLGVRLVSEPNEWQMRVDLFNPVVIPHMLVYFFIF